MRERLQCLGAAPLRRGDDKWGETGSRSIRDGALKRRAAPGEYLPCHESVDPP